MSESRKICLTRESTIEIFVDGVLLDPFNMPFNLLLRDITSYWMTPKAKIIRQRERNSENSKRLLEARANLKADKIAVKIPTIRDSAEWKTEFARNRYRIVSKSELEPVFVITSKDDYQKAYERKSSNDNETANKCETVNETANKCETVNETVNKCETINEHESISSNSEIPPSDKMSLKISSLPEDGKTSEDEK